MELYALSIMALVTGFILDQCFGDPVSAAHPIAVFGRIISFCERSFNRGHFKILKGVIMSIALIIMTFILSYMSLQVLVSIHPVLYFLFQTLIVFFSLSACTLRYEVKRVFDKVEESVEAGRNQVARIVGRDTDKLSKQQIRCAALETLSENLSDGVIAPLFWFALLGAPGMFAYKMLNTLDSMIAYKNERYERFGKFAARADDVANFIPARLTAFIMLVFSGNLNKIKFVLRYGKNHSSPNSGYPEAALAAILNCRFGGPNNYFGTLIHKPFIGIHNRQFNYNDLSISLTVNKRSEFAMLIITVGLYYLIYR